MKRSQWLTSSGLVVMGGLVFGFGQTGVLPAADATGKPAAPLAPAEIRPRVQLAILLDNSGSMSGLLNQARTQLWKVVNEFAQARRDGKAPELQVALYEYGDSPRQLLPLTTDLDKVSEVLFQLAINGGDEYCGAVIDQATKELAWSDNPKDLKVIFICGNEEFTQGSVNYATACKAAITKGIIVNTIFCGGEAEGINTKWQDGAKLADGKYMFIDQNHAEIAIDAPQDAEIAKLNVELNKTYIAYGAHGQESKARQEAQDANAAGSSASVNSYRAMAKSSSNYDNRGWDMVDAVNKDNRKVEDIKEEELPEEMKKMSMVERKAYVDGKQKERTDLQSKIGKLSTERVAYIDAERKKRDGGKTSTLDTAMIQAVREQSQARNFSFEK